MKKLILSAALILGMSVAGFAQGPDHFEHEFEAKSPEDMAQAQTDRLVKELSLNDEQKKQVYDLNLKRSQKLAQEMKSREEEMKAERLEMEKAQKADDEKLAKILTPAQNETYEKLKADRKDKMHKFKGDGKRFGKRPGRMFDHPPLNDSTKVDK